MRDFEGKVAVVTGAASGMGRAFAQRFAEEGMRVVLADIEKPALDAAVAELRQQEHDVIGVQTDVSNIASVENLARETIAAYGKVHVVCNNAGVTKHTGEAVWELTDNDWQWLVGVNFWGVVHGIRVFVPLMLEHGEDAHVVNTASMAGLVVGSGAYGAAKHAVVSFPRASTSTCSGAASSASACPASVPASSPPTSPRRRATARPSCRTARL